MTERDVNPFWPTYRYLYEFLYKPALLWLFVCDRMFENHLLYILLLSNINVNLMLTIRCFLLKHVTMEDSYLCGYLKIKGLTEVRFLQLQISLQFSLAFVFSVLFLL